MVQAEIDALSSAGGGVLFFPAGKYDFSDDEIPTGDYHFLPDGEFLLPLDGQAVSLGETIEFVVEASDGSSLSDAVEVWRDLLKEGDAVASNDSGTFSVTLTAPEELGTHYYFLKVDGSPEPFWSAPRVLVVEETAPYEPLGWILTPWGWIEDLHAPWFYIYPGETWVYAAGYEPALGESAPEFYFYDTRLNAWCWTSGGIYGFVYVLGGDNPGWRILDNSTNKII